MKTLPPFTHPILYTLFFFFIFSTTCFSETRYVTDKLVISVRNGPGQQYKVLENISTGTPLTVLEDKGDFIKVQVNDTLKGWVSKYYTEKDIPKAQVIASLNREIERMAQENEEQAEELANLKKLKSDFSSKQALLDKTTSELNEIKKKYDNLLDQSKEVVATIEERDRLEEEYSLKNQEILELATENKTLKNYKMIYWFATGGGIFLIGWLIGKLSQKGPRRSLTL